MKKAITACLLMACAPAYAQLNALYYQTTGISFDSAAKYSLQILINQKPEDTSEGGSVTGSSLFSLNQLRALLGVQSNAAGHSPSFYW